MVHFHENALIIEIPCGAGEAVDFYEGLQNALHGVYWLVTASSDESQAVDREINFIAAYLGPALAKLDPLAKKAIMGQAKVPSDLQLTYDEWKQKHFSGIPDEWTKRFWVSYQKENNGPFAHVELPISPKSDLENLSFSAIQNAFPEIKEMVLAELVMILNGVMSGSSITKDFSLAELHQRFPDLSEKRLCDLLKLLNQVHEQEDSRQAKGGSGKDALLEQITQRLETLDLRQLQDIDSRLNDL